MENFYDSLIFGGDAWYFKIIRFGFFTKKFKFQKGPGVSIRQKL
jgi:hypothetical protein